MFKSPFKSAVVFCIALLVVIGAISNFKTDNANSQPEVREPSTSPSNISVSAADFLKTISDEKLINSEELLTSQNVEFKEVNMSNTKLIKKNNEITDLNELVKIAKKEKTEFINSKMENNFKGNAISERISEEEVLQVNHYQATQLLEEYVDSNNNEIEVYAVTKLVEAVETNDIGSGNEPESSEADTPLTNLSNNNSELIFQNTASKNDSKWDPTLGVKAYSTIYLTKTSTSQGTFIDLSSVTGGWTIADSSYTLTNMNVRLNQTGVSSSGAVNIHVDKYPTSKTWSYSAPTAWKPVSADASGAGQAFVGAGQYTKIKKGTSSWQFDWANNW